MNWLQQIADRPIGDGERRGAFLAAAFVLVVAATILLVVPVDQPDVDAPVAAVTSSRERVDSGSAEGTEAQDALESAARRFLTDYLRFAYGQADVRSIGSVSPSLRAKLVRSHERVTPAARTRNPSVNDLEVRDVASGRAAATAIVEVDGVSFPITMKLEARDGRWLVDAVGAD